MNHKIEELSKGLAVQVVAQKIADGALDVSGSQTFEGLTRMVEAAILELAKGFGEKDSAAPAKPKKAPRKAVEPRVAPGGRRSGIEPEALKAFIGKSQEGAASLQQIADNFAVSKGVAQRAVEALGTAVKSGTGTKPEGQRGKAPTVFWIE